MLQRNNTLFLSFIAFGRLIRVPNLLIIFITQYAVAFFIIGIDKNEIYLKPGFFMLSLSTILIMAAGYIINDYYDIKIDAHNKPSRVLIGRVIARRTAIIAHGIFNLIGLVLAFFISTEFFLIVLGVTCWLWFYSNYLKRTPFLGNFSVAILTALCIILVGFYFRENLFLVNIYAIFAFFAALIRQILKDIAGVHGDAFFGAKTLPLLWGIRKVKALIYFIVFVFTLVALFLLLKIDNQFLQIYFAFMAIPYGWFLYKLIIADTRKEFKYLSNFSKAILITGMLSMMFLKI